MTLKRSISKKVKNTLAKTKRLVSPSIGSMRSPSSTTPAAFGVFDDQDDDNSLSSCLSTPSWDPSARTNSSHPNEPFQGLGIFKDGSSSSPSQQQLQLQQLQQQYHTPTNSISSIQKSVSHIISATKSNLNSSSSTTDHSNPLIPASGSSSSTGLSSGTGAGSSDANHHPTLLYTGRRKSNSIRRNKSVQQIHSLDYIDTSPNLNAHTVINSTTHIPTPNSFTNSKDYFHDVSSGRNDDDEVVLLPVDPVDKSKPPCTTEQLTPILPLSLESSFISGSGNGNSYFDLNPNDKPPLIVSNLSSTTSTTLNSSFAESNLRGTPTSSTASPIRITLSASNFKPDEVTEELLQPDVNPIFAKSHQIDHLDKELDLRKKDRLADQMALNILQHITEENVDELSKLKEEISMKF